MHPTIMRKRSAGQELTLGGTGDVVNYKATEPYMRYSFSHRKFGLDVTYSGTFTYGHDNYLKTDEYTENRKKHVNYDDKSIDYMAYDGHTYIQKSYRKSYLDYLLNGVMKQQSDIDNYSNNYTYYHHLNFYHNATWSSRLTSDFNLDYVNNHDDDSLL